MNKKYYLWLEIIRKNNPSINIEYIKNNISHSNINALLKEDDSKDVKLDVSIEKCFLDKNIKEKVCYLYNKIENDGLDIITIEDKRFPKKLLLNKNCPFCIIVSKEFRHNLNNNIAYIYYDAYFSKSALSIIKYNYKVITNYNVEVISEYEDVDAIKIECLEKYLNNDIKDNYLFSLDDYIFLINDKEEVIKLIDIALIVEAKYDRKIVKIVDYMLEKSKPILVFPNSIFNKNGFFSNYLIKQGADVILNKNDLIFALNTLSC